MIIGQDFKIFSFDWIHCIFLLSFLLLSSVDKIFFKSTQSFFFIKMKVAKIFMVFILIAKARSKKRVSVSTGIYSPQPVKCFKIFFFQDDENLALNSESHVQSGSSQDGK